LREIDPGPGDPEFGEADFLRARAGERHAFAALVRAQQRMVYGIAVRMLGDRALAEDVAQEVFLSLHRSLKSIESLAHLKFWLRRATSHRGIDRLRARGEVILAPLASAEQLPAPAREADPLLEQRLQQLLLLLTPPARAVLLLRYQQDLDPAEIARTLDMPVNTVKSHLKRSLETLRDWLTDTPENTVS
jgi:RNA polymerase sigma-70 factor (ECF subfamily)